jgi:beta-lactamase regulating signal transducer with metallopeptidase domain/Tol biopolymer transport system component
MSQVINNCLVGLNNVGRAFWGYAAGMIVQAGVLVVLLLIIDFLLRKRVRASLRYCLWMLVFVKLVLPPTLCLPTGIGYWCGDYVSSGSPVLGHISDVVQPRAVGTTAPQDLTPSADIPEAEPLRKLPGTAPAVTSTVSSLAPLTWQAILFVVWLVCVLVLFSLLIKRMFFVRRLIAQSMPADGRLLDILKQCRRELGIARAVELRLSDSTPGPAVCGFFRPTILMPAVLSEKLTSDKLRTVLIHEFAHIKRGDLWVNSMQTFLQVIYFYNPFVWLVNIIVRRIREQAVDEMVLVALGAEAKSYSNTLIDIAEMAFWKANLSLRLVGVVESKKALQRRIKHMLSRPIPKTARVGALGTIVILVVAAVLLPMARAERSNKDTSVTSQPTGAGASETAPVAGEGDILVNPKTGLKFVLAKTIAGANDVIEDENWITTLSPNGKFLLWDGHVVPLDGSPAFTLKELQGAGVESWSASWSPDGRKIAFNSEGIEVLPVSPETGRPTGAARKLLQEKGGWFRGKIYWSADSERILFMKYNRQWEREIGTINLRDGRLNKQPDYADFGLLSPDGQTVAYSMPDDGIWAKPVSGGPAKIARPRSGGWLSDDAVVWTSDSQWVVSAVNVWCREEIHFARVSDGQNFDVFPPEAVGVFIGKSTDGKKLYFYRSSSDLRPIAKVVPVSGGPASSISAFAGADEIWDYSWTSDSASLAVLGMDEKARQQLWLIPLMGGERVRFDMESLGKDKPWLESLCPDGRKLLYSVAQGDDFYVVPISLKDGMATGAATLVFEGWQSPYPNIAQQEGAWSPDGTKIAVPQKSDQGCELWVLFADGGKPIRITQTPYKLGPWPGWSPDGKMIAFNLIAADREMLQVIPAEGGTARTILTTPKEQSPPFGWSSDSKEVVVACNGTISSFPITGGSARVIVRLQDAGYESASWLGWSPDGQRLAFYGGKRGEASRLCLFSPSSGKVEKLENSPDAAEDFLWSPDSKMICCTAEEAVKTRPAGVIRELDVAEAVQKAPPVAERKPTEANAAPQAELIAGPVFTDSFDNGPSKHWQILDSNTEMLPPPGHATVNGELMLSNSSVRLDQIDWPDYVVTVRVCMKESIASGEGVFGIQTRTTPCAFGVRNRDRYNLVITCLDGLPTGLYLGINYRDPSNTGHKANLGRSSYTIVPDKWYTLEFEVRGQKLRGYLDGKLMVEATDERLSKGGIWLSTWRSRALFDDFSVRQLP